MTDESAVIEMEEALDNAKNFGVHHSLLTLTKLQGLSDAGILEDTCQEIVDESIELINQYKEILGTALQNIPDDNVWKLCVMPYVTGMVK